MPPLPFKRRAIEIFDPFHSFIGQFIGDFFSLLLMYRIFGKRVNMRFIAACVGFSLLVLIGLLYFLTQRELGFSSEFPSKRISKVIRADRKLPRIGIHNIIVFNTTPKTFAITGKSDSTGRRELLTSLDSVLYLDDNIGWARGVFESFDWTEKENPTFIHRGSTIPFYNIDTLYESGVIKNVYREEQTYGFYKESLSPMIFLKFISIYLLTFFIISVSIGWKIWQRTLFVIFLLLLLESLSSSIYFFGNQNPTINPRVFSLGGIIVTLHSIQWILFGVISITALFLRSKFVSRFVYEGLYFIIIVFSFPVVCLITRRIALDINDEFYNSVCFMYSNLNVVTVGMISSMGIGFASLGVFLMNNYKDTNRLKNVAIQSQLRTAEQLNSLNARLNPHFLYNSLNAIAGLINSDPLKAEEMTLAISRFLKHFSNRKEEHVITVKEEVAVILDYISIEKIRFEEKLHFEYSVDEDSLASNIPRSILQPLIENAVKYGYSKDTNVISVRLQIETKEDDLMIRIYDSGGRFDTSLDKGYGISSVFNKLELLYKGQYSFEFVNEPEKHIEIIIPSQMSMADA